MNYTLIGCTSISNSLKLLLAIAKNVLIGFGSGEVNIYKASKSESVDVALDVGR